MVRKNSNKSFYHYSVTEYKKDGEEVTKYYMTLKELGEDFLVHPSTINKALNNQDHIIRKYPNFIFKRVHVPKFISVLNPQI
jgi:hypothetical protein